MEGAGEAEGRPLGDHAVGCEFALGTDEGDFVADGGPHGVGQIRCPNEGGQFFRFRQVQDCERGSRACTDPGVAVLRRLLTVFSSLGRMPSISAPPSRAPRATSDLLIQSGRAAVTCGRRRGVRGGDANRGCRRTHAHELHVGGGTEEPVLHVAPHAVGDGEGDDERGDAGGNAGDGDGGDHADDGLAPLGFQITRGDKELKSHLARLRLVRRCLERRSLRALHCRAGHRRGRSAGARLFCA